MNLQFEEFLKKSHQIRLLLEIGSLLRWDMQTQLPAGGGERRGEQNALISTQIHALRSAPEYSDLLEELSNENLEPIQAAAVHAEFHEVKKSLALPASLIADLEKQKSRSYSIWENARRDKDVSPLVPELEKMIHLKRQVGECLKGPRQNAYDGLLSEFESDVPASVYETLFKSLKPELLSLMQKLSTPPQKGELRRSSIADQEALNRWILSRIGFDFNRGRLDVTAHPFASNVGNDIRLTTRYDADDWRSSFFASLHEMGHGLYERGMLDLVPLEPLMRASGFGMHESQSRFWENTVGRSREFCSYLMKAPAEYKSILGDHPGELFNQVNEVRPSFIRVEADEVTYNLHILLRFELEKGIFNGDIKAKDLAQIWNERFKALFNLAVPSDDLGVLQDIHWPVGYFGYFPTYTLGNLIAAQVRDAISKEMNFSQVVENGEFTQIRNWLGEKIHRFGTSKPTLELARLATGKELSHEPLIHYFKQKFSCNSV